jgi:tryptophan synthase alpha chain
VIPATAANRLISTLAALRARQRCALIPYLMAGDPSPEATVRLVDLLVASGADAVELGVPFSDPIADGPVNQRAGMRALARGMGLRAALDLVARVRARTPVPLVFMTYYNLVLRYGVAAFARSAVDAGLDGLILADLPPDEAGELVAASRAAGLATVFLLAPTSTDARIRAVCGAATGFVYCVSRTGVTGVRETLPEGLRDLVLRIRRHTAAPVCVGFGISNAAQAREVARIADGVIVGSALVRMLEEAPDAPDRLGTFVRELRAAVDARPGPPETAPPAPPPGTPPASGS